MGNTESRAFDADFRKHSWYFTYCYECWARAMMSDCNSVEGFYWTHDAKGRPYRHIDPRFHGVSPEECVNCMNLQIKNI